MKTSMDRELNELGARLIRMGALCETAIAGAASCLQNREKENVSAVFGTDAAIDHMHHELEDMCLRLILTRQPVAGDLRAVTAAMQIAGDMERIGDQAADVTEILRFWDSGVFAGGTHIDKKAQAASKMVTDAIDSFVRRDDELAQSVIAADDRVDELFVRVWQELIELIARQDQNGVACMDLLMIAKYFERIADHAENIARWVLYRLHGTLPERDDVRGGR